MEVLERWFTEPLEERCEFVQWIQSWRCKPLDWYAHFSSALSDEEFYISLLVVLHWFISSQVCLHISLLMSTGFVLGNMAISLPIWLTVYLIRDLGITSPTFLAWYIPCVFLWVLSISWSRLYLGAHSGQDIIAGWIVGTIVSLIYCLFSNTLEARLMAHDAQCAGQVFAFAVLITYLHPMEVFINNPLGKWSIIVSQSGYLTSCDLAGVIAGVAIGIPGAPDNVPISVFERPYAALFRVVVGGTLCAVTYILGRKILRSVLLLGYNAVGLPVFDPPAKNNQIPPTLTMTLKKEGDRVSFESLNVHTFTNGMTPGFQRFTQSHLGLLLLGSGLQIMPIAKFIQYGALSFMVCSPAPHMFRAFGL